MSSTPSLPSCVHEMVGRSHCGKEITTGSDVVLSQDDSGGPSCRSWINRLQSHGCDPIGESFGRQNRFFLETQHKLIVQSVCLISDFYSALCNINPRACFLGEVIVVTSVA